MLRKNEILILAGMAALAFLFKNEAMGAVSAVTQSDDFYRYDSLFKKYGAQYGVPWRWIKAVSIVESNLGRAKSVARGIASPSDDEGSKSSDGLSWGVMQTTLETARKYGGAIVTAAWLNVPENSIKVGAAYLANSIRVFGKSDRESVIRSYNGGTGFKKTVLGQTVTPIYYAKFLAALNTVLTAQPGNEME